jgi:heptaprenyl diphosphate synthase
VKTGVKAHQLFEDISSDLTQVEAGLLRVVSPQQEILTQIGGHLLQAGGKRMRPALFLLTAKTQEYNMERLLPVAVSLELIHMATLVHDDVIDEAKTRRGYPTASAKWGNLTAVLAGDFLFAQAFTAIAHIADSRVIGAMSQVVSSMCEGEIIQISSTYDVRQTEGAYLIRIQKKTADFIACACELGSYMAGASTAVVDSMKDYGHCLGMAFQITDDILDIIGTEEQIGKPAGNDLKQGMMTLPIIYALHNAPNRDILCRIIEKKDMRPEDVATGLEIIRSTDAIKYAYGLVDRYISRAKERVTVIEDLNLRENFHRIADFVGQRSY